MGGSKYKIHIHCVWVNLGRFLFNRQNPVSPALPLLPLLERTSPAGDLAKFAGEISGEAP